MSFSTVMKIVSYVAGAAVVTIATAGLGAPVWVTAVAASIATVSGNLASSHFDSVNIAAGQAALTKQEEKTV